ncbi:hypothetical protein D3C84_1252010 [compost metagenome]
MVAFYGVGNDQITIAIVGILGVVGGYYFGSSQGSAKKQDTIDAMQNQTLGIGGSNTPPDKDEK